MCRKSATASSTPALKAALVRWGSTLLPSMQQAAFLTQDPAHLFSALDAFRQHLEKRICYLPGWKSKYVWAQEQIWLFIMWFVIVVFVLIGEYMWDWGVHTCHDYVEVSSLLLLWFQKSQLGLPGLRCKHFYSLTISLAQVWVLIHSIMYTIITTARSSPPDTLTRQQRVGWWFPIQTEALVGSKLWACRIYSI